MKPDELQIGRCIYCGRTDGILQKEHIIPLAIGGVDILRRASCPTCAKAINTGYEGRLWGDQFLATRTVLKLPTQHPAKRRTSFRTKVRRNGIWREEDVPAELYPAVMAWPLLPVPAVISGIVATSFHFRQVKHIGINAALNDPEIRAKLRANGIEAIDSTFKLEPYLLARELLKIGYGYAVKVLGIDAIEPLALGCILNEDEALPRWVGGPVEGMGAASAGGPHSVVIHVRDGDQLVFAAIRLFTGLLPDRVPEYWAVVGRLRMHDLGTPTKA
jgi:hypothetical protein